MTTVYAKALKETKNLTLTLICNYFYFDYEELQLIWAMYIAG